MTDNYDKMLAGLVAQYREPDPATDSYGYMIWALGLILRHPEATPVIQALAFNALDAAGECGV